MLELPISEPWSNLYQRQADDAFARAEDMSHAQLATLRPPLPQIVFLPPRFGYPPYPERQWSLWDVFDMTKSPRGYIPGMPSTRPEERVDYSRSQSDYHGTSRLTNGGDPLGLGGASW